MTMRVAPAAALDTRWDDPQGEQQAAAWAWLSAWCFEGAGTGRAPLLRPWVMPQVDARLTVALLSGASGASGVGKSRLAQACARKLDGSDRLDALRGCWAGRRLRLAVKLQDCCWWRARRHEDPWDSGYLVDDPGVRRGLGGFRPGRATLLIADGVQPDTLLPYTELLRARQHGFRHPVRRLVIDQTLPITPWPGEVHVLRALLRAMLRAVQGAAQRFSIGGKR